MTESSATKPSAPGDAAFLSLSARVHRLTGEGIAPALRSLPTLPGMLRDAVETRRNVPVVPIRVCPEAQGTDFLRCVSYGWGPWRAPRPVLSVLRLDADLPSYLRGRRKQALRTNLRSGTTRGLTSEGFVGSADALVVIRDVLSSRDAQADREQRQPEWYLRHGSDRRFVVRDADGTGLAFAAVATMDGQAYLRTLLSASLRDEASDARYTVHTAVVSGLIDQSYARLWADGPLTIPAGVQYFQRLLGYVCARPRLVKGSSAASDDPAPDGRRTA